MSGVSRAVGVTVAGVALTLVAFTFDASPLFVPAVAFVLLGLASTAWVYGAGRGAQVKRRLRADRVHEDQPLEATLHVSWKALGLPGAQVADPMAVEPVAVAAPLSLIKGGREARFRVVARFPRRGLRRLEGPTLVVCDPLELARVSVPGTPAIQEVLVLPRIERVRYTDAGRALRSSANVGAQSSEPFAAHDVDGLRPYRPGTPASRIHWAALARGAGLLERRLLPDGDTRPLVVLDARGDGPPEHLDAAVRAAGSLALEFARRGGCGLLLPGERRPIKLTPDLTGWPAAHARLALVAPGVRPPTIPPGAHLGPLLYVAAVSLERLPAGMLGRDRANHVLVLPHELSHHIDSRPSFEVAGCYGFSVGARAELAAAG